MDHHCEHQHAEDTALEGALCSVWWFWRWCYWCGQTVVSQLISQFKVSLVSCCCGIMDAELKPRNSILTRVFIFQVVLGRVEGGKDCIFSGPLKTQSIKLPVWEEVGKDVICCLTNLSKHFMMTQSVQWTYSHSRSSQVTSSTQELWWWSLLRLARPGAERCWRCLSEPQLGVLHILSVLDQDCCQVSQTCGRAVCCSLISL